MICLPILFIFCYEYKIIEKHQTLKLFALPYYQNNNNNNYYNNGMNQDWS